MLGENSPTEKNGAAVLAENGAIVELPVGPVTYPLRQSLQTNLKKNDASRWENTQ
jgi:hypothetical protein